jgi:flagellar biosynthesis component FlhA
MDIIVGYISGIDPSVRTLPDAVYTIWWTVLLLVVIVIVPLVIGLLHRTLRASLSIRRYFVEMLTAGVGIAENTSSIPALKDTITVGAGMVETAGKLKEHSGTIADVFSQRAKGV